MVRARVRVLCNLAHLLTFCGVFLGLKIFLLVLFFFKKYIFFLGHFGKEILLISLCFMWLCTKAHQNCISGELWPQMRMPFGESNIFSNAMIPWCLLSPHHPEHAMIKPWSLLSLTRQYLIVVDNVITTISFPSQQFLSCCASSCQHKYLLIIKIRILKGLCIASWAKKTPCLGLCLKNFV